VIRTPVTVVLALAACGGGQTPPPKEPEPPTPIGRTVDLILPSIDGDAVELSSFRGRPVAVHFSTTGSLGAQIDLDELRSARAARRELVLVEVALDPTRPKLIAAWANASNIDWLVLLPRPGLVAGDTAFGPIRVTPTTYVLDRDLRIVWGHEGPLPRGVLAQAVGGIQ
jgi:hypothetical protein